MRHCCEFKADDIYYLADTELYTQRKLSIGFCPNCGKPVAELFSVRFDGVVERTKFSGIKAHELVIEHKDAILYSLRECNYRKFKSKPYSWRYGINKLVKINGKERIRQYACDFYGNKEQIKLV